jgi:hypothetical protein
VCYAARLFQGIMPHVTRCSDPHSDMWHDALKQAGSIAHTLDDVVPSSDTSAGAPRCVCCVQLAQQRSGLGPAHITPHQH